MAMMIAIGQLQKHAGSDTRTTAAADMAGGSGGIAATAGAAPQNNNSINSLSKGLTAVQNGSRFWTGVWTNRDNTTQIYSRTPSPALLQWLISGDETKQATLVGTTYTAHNGIQPNNTAIAVNGSGFVTDPTKAVILAGKNTVGDPGAATLPNYVSAPLVDVRTDATNKVNGRYAWWVGDEGVKAKIHIPQKILTTPSMTLSPPSVADGIRSVDLRNTPRPLPPSMPRWQKLSFVEQCELLTPAAAAKASEDSPLQSAFHSATANSLGLLVDHLNGGVKVDLHTILNATPSEEAVFNDVFFRIRANSLEPGEARAYTIAGFTKRAVGQGTARIVVDLVPFSSAAPFNFNNSVELDMPRVYSAADLADIVTSATKFSADGAFNISSTDKNAWKAFLGSSKHFRHKAE
jgi:hypothetical protein